MSFHSRCSRSTGFTGLQTLDRILGPIDPGYLMVLAGAEDAAASFLMQQWLAHGAACKRSAALFCGDTTAQTVWATLLAMEGSLEPWESEPHAAPDALRNEIGDWLGVPVFVCDAPVTFPRLRASLEDHLAKHEKPSLLVVDPIQAGTGLDPDKEPLGHAFKQLGRELGIPVLLVYRACRDEGQGDLNLEHLGGDIEISSDVILTLKNADPFESEGLPDHLNLKILKNRKGPCGAISLTFSGGGFRYEEVGVNGAGCLDQ